MLSLKSYLDNIAFMTRLASPRIIPENEMNRCMAYMPLVGLTLGCIIVLPFYFGLYASSPWIQAWLMVIASIYLTRGLHFDAVADVSDAVTAHTNPDTFWEVIKDSRSGAFAITGLGVAISGQIILFHEMFTAQAYGPLIWSFMLGRTACVGFGYIVRHLARPGLGKMYIDGATLPVTLITTSVTILLGFILVGPAIAIAAIGITTLALYPLHRLAEEVQGANGDFLGCSIIIGELAAGLGFALCI